MLLVWPRRSLKYLEQWIDNLNPGFLMPLLSANAASVLQPLMSSLYAMVKPQPSANGQEAFRILGKFGAANRDFLSLMRHNNDLKYRHHLDSSVVVQLDWSDPVAAAAAVAAAAPAVATPGGGESTGNAALDAKVQAFMKWAASKRRRVEDDSGAVAASTTDAALKNGASS